MIEVIKTTYLDESKITPMEDVVLEIDMRNKGGWTAMQCSMCINMHQLNDLDRARVLEVMQALHAYAVKSGGKT